MCHKKISYSRSICLLEQNWIFLIIQMKPKSSYKPVTKVKNPEPPKIVPIGLYGQLGRIELPLKKLGRSPVLLKDK